MREPEDPGQPGLFDQPEGERRREEGVARALDHAGAWKHEAATCIAGLALSGKSFTSEDVILLVGMPPGHPSAVGACLNAASRSGLIVWTGEVRKAKRPSCHAAMLKVWRGAG